MKIKFLTSRDGFKLYEVADVEDEQAQVYLDASQAVEVKENGIRETETQANDTTSDT